MPLRTRVQFALTLPLAGAAFVTAAGEGSRPWLPFLLLTAATLCCSGLRLRLPNNENSLSASFPFLALGLLILSPLQAVLLGALSVVAELSITRAAGMGPLELAFNVANTVLATSCAAQVLQLRLSSGLPQGLLLLLAASAFFLFQTLNMTAVGAPRRGRRMYRFWFGEYLGYLPFYLIGALLALLTQELAKHFGWSTAMMLIPGAYTLYRTYMDQLRRLGERQRHLRETEALHLRIIEGLAMAIEAKDQNTHEHLFRVRKLAEGVGQELHLNAGEMKALQTAAFLHDIGKLAVPEHILNKPGRLTPEEFDFLKIHPGVGAEILERIRFPYPVVPIVRSHHEWWNGAGYPDGLAGEAIPIGARILTVIDCFDALTSDRPYRKGMSETQAMEIIAGLAGTQFDPRVLEAFQSCELQTKPLQQELLPGEAFAALNTELEVLRGFAPGAGFEAGSDAKPGALNAPQARTPDFEHADDGVGLLLRTAAARGEAQGFFELSQGSYQFLALEELFDLLAGRLRTHIPHDACALHVLHGRNLAVAAASGEAAASFSRAPFPVGAGISGWVAQQHHPLLNGNCDVEPPCPRRAGAALFSAALAFPLLDTANQIFAVLTFYARARDTFDREHLHILQAMSSKLGLALSNALEAAATEIPFQTHSVAGLHTFNEFFLAVDAQLKKGQDPGAVLCFRFSSSGEWSGRRGRIFSERLLGSLAGELRRALRPGEALARLGEDEFALLTAAGGRNLVARCAEVEASAHRACQRAGSGVPLRVHFGSATSPEDGATAEMLLAKASRRAHLESRLPPLVERNGSAAAMSSTLTALSA